MRVFSLILVSVTVSTSLHAPTKAQSRRTTAEAMKQKGLELVKYLDIDVDGDGRKELVCVGKDDKGLRLAIVGDDKDGAVVRQVLPPAKGKEIASFAGQSLTGGAAQQVVFEVYDETPDEKEKRVRVYGSKDGVMKEIFSSVLRRSKRTDDRPAWERDDSIIKYGDARGGWFFADLEEDGVKEIVVRKAPQVLSITGKDDPVKLMTGVREQVWRFDVDSFVYQERGERLNNFLPPYDIVKVTASSAYIDPVELKELKANALHDALTKDEGKDGKEGAAGGEFDFGLEDLGVEQPKKKDPKKAPVTTPKKPAVKAEKEKEPEIEIDRTPYMRMAADRNLSTAWVEDKTGSGKGEWVEVELEEESPINMVRVVVGCVDTKQSFKAFDVPESFQIRLDNGSDATVNRREPKVFDKPILAFTELKVTDRPWAKQTVAFYDGKRSAKRVRVTLDKVIKQGKGDRACISEVSVH